MDALRSFLIDDAAVMVGRKKLERTSFFLGLMAVFLVGSVGWAGVFEIDRVVRAEGKIIPLGRSRPIQHLEGGIVSTLDTAEGLWVKKGDLLLTIDATSAGASLNENKVKLVALRAKAARLKAEADGTAQISFSEEVTSEVVQGEEQRLFRARKHKLEQDLRVHQETIREHMAGLLEVESRRKKLEGELTIAQKRSALLDAMAARRAASQMELLEAQSREKRLETEIKDAEASIPRLKASLATEQARVASAQADFRTQAQEELVEVSAEIDRLSQLSTAAEDRVRRTEIRAPIDGVINRMSVATVGEVVKPGEAVIELTPGSEDVLIEARVQPKDRGDLQPGIPAKVRVSAYDVGKFGVLSGKLQDVSADTMQDSEKTPYYRAKILIERLPPAFEGHPILPGMTVAADLVIGQRTILSHLLSPLSKFTTSMFRDTR